MQGLIPIWVGLGLAGAMIYLVRMHYLVAFLRDQVLPAFTPSGESDLGSMLISSVFNVLLVFMFLVIRNLPLWVLAVLLGPFAIAAALLVQPEKAIRVLAIDLERDTRLEASENYSHYVVGENALRCEACGSLTSLGPCPDCNSATYGPSTSVIRCRKCHKFIDRWTCTDCGAVNKMSSSLVELRPYLVAGGR